MHLCQTISSKTLADQIPFLLCARWMLLTSSGNLGLWRCWSWLAAALMQTFLTKAMDDASQTTLALCMPRCLQLTKGPKHDHHGQEMLKMKSFATAYNYRNIMPTSYSVGGSWDATVVNRNVHRDRVLKGKARGSPGV